MIVELDVQSLEYVTTENQIDCTSSHDGNDPSCFSSKTVYRKLKKNWNRN